MKNIKLWIKKNLWKILIPIIIIPAIILLYYIKKQSEIREIVGYASEK